MIFFGVLPLTKLEITGITGRMVLVAPFPMKILPTIALIMLYTGIVANAPLFYTTWWS